MVASERQLTRKPHIVLIIARGEAVRNFLYSDTLQRLSECARVTLLSVLHDEEFRQRFGPYVEKIIPLEAYQEKKLVLALRDLILYAHYRWIWTEKVKNKWQILAAEANSLPQKIKFYLWKLLVFLLANRPALDLLASIENRLTLWLKPTRHVDELFEMVKPDLVFNCSHIHAPAGELPVRIAHQKGIPTAAFIFSWDNLSSRGRILPPYDYYLVWHRGMREQLLSLYPFMDPKQVFITGTPQFDFHFQPRYCMPREELCAHLGLDPSRPYILYTTGVDRDFPEEHRFVHTMIDLLHEFDPAKRPQLIVRMYIKGISAEMLQLSQQNIPDVIFPPVLWEEKWFTPRFDDLEVYSSLLHHAHMGINPASTVTLELLMLGKPVVNLGFDPPGSHLPPGYHWSRHIQFDHFRAVADSGAVMVAYSVDDLRSMLRKGICEPNAGQEARYSFIRRTFGETLDGQSGKRAAEVLLRIVAQRNDVRLMKAVSDLVTTR